MLHITYPLVLYLLLPLSGVFVFLLLTNKTQLERVFDKQTLKRLLINPAGPGPLFRTGLLYVAFFLIVIALSRPVYLYEHSKVTEAKPAAILALDASLPMQSRDFYPNRLEFAKEKMKDFITGARGRELGIIVFARNTYLLAPPTTSYEILLQKLDSLEISEVITARADVEKAALEAKKLLADRGRGVIFFTAGDHGAVKQNFWRQNGLVPMALVCAHKAGAPLLNKKGEPQNRSWSKPNGNFLNQLEYFAYAGTSDKSASKFFTLLEKERFSNTRFEHYLKKELFIYLLVIALGLVFTALFDPLAKLRKYLAVLILLPMAVPVQGFDHFALQDAKQAYEQGAYEKALEAYKEVEQSDKRDYNIGNIYYKTGAYKKALAYYKAVSFENSRRYYKLLHNMGNAYYQLGAFQKAVSSYEKALRVREDKATRRNLALAKKRQREGGSKPAPSSEGVGEKITPHRSENRKKQQTASTLDEGRAQSGRRDVKKYEKMIKRAPAQLILLR